jgi:hypothetical protein
MNPTGQPQQSGQLSDNWGNPSWVQQFRNKALSNGAGGQKQVDDFIAQNQAAYQQQVQHATNTQVYGQTAGGITPDQALKDPTATQNFLKGGGKIVDPITNMAQAVIKGDMTLSDIGDSTQKAQVDASVRGQGLDVNRLPNDPQTRTIKGSLQALLDTYNKLPDDKKGPGGELGSKIPYFGRFDPVTTYEQQRRGLSASLSPALGPGKGNGLRISAPEIEGWSNLLPQSGKTLGQNQTSIISLDKKMRAATGVGLDNDYLTALNVSRDDKGKYIQGKTAQDNGGILPAIGNTISNIPKDAGNVLNGILNIPATVAKNTTVNMNPLNGNPLQPLGINVNPQLGVDAIQNYAGNLNKDLGQPMQGGDILGRAGQNFQDRPVSTVLDVLPFLGAKNAMAAKAGDAAGPTATQGPGILKQILQPQAAKNMGSQMRDTAIANAVKEGKTVAGEDILTGLNKWANTAKIGNLSEGKKIQEALDNAQTLFKDKQMHPQDIVDAYKSADSGFTQNGVPKTATQALIDRGLRDVLAKQLENVAPGWEQGTKIIGKSFKTDKSIPGKIAKNVPGKAVSVGLQAAGLGALGRILGL